MIDSLSPATRMAVIKPSARDRVLSAIQNAIESLSANLKTMQIELENGNQVDNWSGRYIDEKRMMAVSEAEEHVHRKSKGVAMLKVLSELLVFRSKRPVMKVCRLPTSSSGLKEFQKQQLPSLVAEAQKYGWQVDDGLKCAIGM